MSRSIRMGLFTCAIASSSILGAQPAQAPGTDDLSLADLMSITIVTASKEAEPINEAPGVISTLSRDEIDRLGPASLKQLLLTMPGITATSGFLFDRSSIAIQGDKSKENTSHILFLINGRPIREVQEGGLSADLLEGFPTSAIDHIEVIKGPGSVLYGSDAFTGVINIITRKPSEDRATVNVMATPESGRRGDASFEMASGDLKISQSATYNRFEPVDAAYTYHDLATGANRPVPIHMAPTSYGAHTQIDYKDFNAFVGYAQTTNFTEVLGTVDQALQEKAYANLGYSHVVNNWWNFSLNAGITRTEARTDSFPNIQRSSYEALGEVTNFFTIGKGKAVVGAVMSYRNGEERNWLYDVSANQADFTGFSGYTQVSYPVIEPVLLIGGLQYNQVLGLKPAQAPRAGLVWSISNSLSLKALWSNAYRAPSLNELNLKAPNLVGNKDLKPENVETYDLALSYNGHDFYSSANVFYSKLTDIIQEEAVAIAAFGSPVTGMYQNAGNIQIMGAGMEIKGYVTKALLVSGSVNYQESFNDDGQWDLLPVPLYTGKLGVSYVSTAGWDMGVANVFMGDYSSLFTTGKVNPAPQGSIQTDLNAKLSLARWLKLQGKQDLALRAQVKNLFDVVTTIPEWGGPSKDALPDLRGRVFYLGMDMRI